MDELFFWPATRKIKKEKRQLGSRHFQAILLILAVVVFQYFIELVGAH